MVSTGKAPSQAMPTGNRVSWAPRPDMAAARYIPPIGSTSYGAERTVESIGPFNPLRRNMLHRRRVAGTTKPGAQSTHPEGSVRRAECVSAGTATWRTQAAPDRCLQPILPAQERLLLIESSSHSTKSGWHTKWRAGRSNY